MIREAYTQRLEMVCAGYTASTYASFSLKLGENHSETKNHSEIIAERQSVRQINDALGRFYSTLVYVRTYICL